ncbi:uncharacterized protein [Primulina eburnea]|uniref:uncharacterized protein n=1 Tax=Primulina eburnea TaxID=1245227 RepID=UPI003C6C13CB
MAHTRKTNQNTSRVQGVDANHSRQEDAPPDLITMTPAEFDKRINEAVERAMARREASHHDIPLEKEPEKEQEQQQELREEEKRGEVEESFAGSKSPTIVEEMQELKQKMKVLEGQLENRGTSRASVKGRPFAEAIIREPLPGNFKSAKVRAYDENEDPEEHLARFENMAMLHCYTDRIKCKVFLTTLKAFLHHFSSSKKYKKTAFSLFEVRQGPEESLRMYIKRFNKVALDVPTCAAETKTTAFTQGLKESEFFKSLTKKVPEDFEDLLSRAEKYINMEEAQKQKREAIRKERGDRAPKPEERGPRRGNPGHFSPHVPLKIIREREVQECSRDPVPSHQLSQPGKSGFCTRHGVCQQSTENCKALKRSYVPPTNQGHDKYTKRSRGPPWTPRPPVSHARVDSRNNPGNHMGRRREPEPEKRSPSSPVAGLIKMISGGSTDGDSNRARKSRSRRECLEVEGSRRNEAVISFGPEDLKGINMPHNDALVIQARVANYDILRVFVDSGSSVNVIFKDALVQMDLQGFKLETVETALFGFAGHAVYPEGEIVLPLTLGSRDIKKTVMTTFTVVDSPSSYNIILGRPAMNELRAVASTYHQKIKFPVGSQGKSKKEGNKPRVEEVWKGGVEKGEVHFVAEEEQEAVEIGPGQQIRVARDLDVSTRVSLLKCLKTNIHVFAWSQQELTGISPLISEHQLNILPGAHPIKQKKRHFGPEKDKVIDEQVKELLQAGHIREIQFPTWLSNVVLVPKAAGKWRMCVDFRDLNKACPKDHYPLPRIDQLVDSTSGFELLSFMDAYQGYHQIPLAKNDQDKASFITSGGTFCYVVMPFGLKNAGATYQRLMDKVFEKQLGRNLEVYVDDILGKSKEVMNFIADLEETFTTLTSYGVKLNPAKCIFGVKSGKFLGFIVTERGIEVNQEKVKSVLCMPSPRSVKEVQMLTGRIASLSRFISRSAHRSYPFFQVLRKAQKFGWDDKCEQAFQDLKKHLAELPVLVKPEPGDKLFVYLSTTEYAVSSVLIKEEGSDQKPVYYVSHALRGPELRYSEVEKMALALVVTARKLRPYFLSHPIIVLTNSPLGRIMTHSEVSGRMIKWNVELGEYDIEYKPRLAIKAQALSDFLSEMIQPAEEERWRVFVDGASCLVGCGVGVVIISPSGEKIKLAVKIGSRVTNNEAEYEAVLAGIRAAREIGAARIILYSDSQLITQQIKGVYEVKDDKMLKYLHLIKAQAVVFVYWSIEQIPREENGEADALAKNGCFFGPLLKCLSGKEEIYVLQEIHEGCCCEHLGGTSLAQKAMLAGFWWPTLHHDSARVVRTCESCQHHSNFQHSPATPMKPIWASCPFDQWGMDIVGPFPVARVQKKFLLVAVDYFSKWVEAEPLAKITEQ